MPRRQIFQKSWGIDDKGIGSDTFPFPGITFSEKGWEGYGIGDRVWRAPQEVLAAATGEWIRDRGIGFRLPKRGMPPPLPWPSSNDQSASAYLPTQAYTHRVCVVAVTGGRSVLLTLSNAGK